MVPPKQSKKKNRKSDKNPNLYYLYSTTDKKYEEKTPEEMKEFMNSIDKDSFHIVGTIDRFNPRSTNELEI